MKARIQIIGCVVIVVVQGVINLRMTANHNAQLRAQTEAHNAQLVAQTEVHNAQLKELTERYTAQLVAQTAEFQKKWIDQAQRRLTVEWPNAVPVRSN